jgi:hypothetical protein
VLSFVGTVAVNIISAMNGLLDLGFILLAGVFIVGCAWYRLLYSRLHFIKFYLVNRITTYPISEHNLNKEKQTTDYLLKASGYHHLNAKGLIRHSQLRTRKDNQNQKKWANFTYIGKENL